MHAKIPSHIHARMHAQKHTHTNCIQHKAVGVMVLDVLSQQCSVIDTSVSGLLSPGETEAPQQPDPPNIHQRKHTTNPPVCLCSKTPSWSTNSKHPAVPEVKHQVVVFPCCPRLECLTSQPASVPTEQQVRSWLSYAWRYGYGVECEHWTVNNWWGVLTSPEGLVRGLK